MTYLTNLSWFRDILTIPKITRFSVCTVCVLFCLVSLLINFTRLQWHLTTCFLSWRQPRLSLNWFYSIANVRRQNYSFSRNETKRRDCLTVKGVFKLQQKRQKQFHELNWAVACATPKQGCASFAALLLQVEFQAWSILKWSFKSFYLNATRTAYHLYLSKTEAEIRLRLLFAWQNAL